MEELEKLQGTWKIVALEVEGREMAPAMFAGASIAIEADNFSTTSMGATFVGKVACEWTEKFSTIDITFTAGPHAGQKSLGIYELAGDTWKLCLGFAGYDRPQEFATAPRSGHALESLRRERSPESAAMNS
jgi:uncharacterized protein (TIGR03067 family)